ALRDLPIVVTLINGNLKSRVRSVIEFPDLCRLTLHRAPHYCLQLGRFLHRIGRFNLLRPSGLPLEACQTASYLFEANSADPTTLFGETTPSYYCRHQLGREEQGCTSSSGGPSTEPHGSPSATLAAPTSLPAPLARQSSPARSVSPASCRPGRGLHGRPSTVRSASHSTARSWPTPPTTGIAGPSPPIRGTLPTISCECATMPSKPAASRSQIPKPTLITLDSRLSPPWNAWFASGRRTTRTRLWPQAEPMTCERSSPSSVTTDR